jgi:arsenate reductase
VSPPLPRRLLAEFLGSAFLAALVIGSGIAAQQLTPDDTGLQLRASSTSFANPAIIVGRMFSDTFAGIAPASVPAFVVAQLVGGVAAFGLVRTLYVDGVQPVSR